MSPTDQPGARQTALAGRQDAVLAGIATGRSLTEILEMVVDLVEDQMPDALASILLMDADHRHLRFAAGRRLIAAYESIGWVVPVGECSGSCGTAAHRREPVIVADALRDPLWADHRAVAQAHGLRACWSFPIFASQSPAGGGPPEVIGTFALYRHESGVPAPAWIETLQGAAHLAGVAIERARALQTLRENETRYRTLVENVNDALFVHGDGGVIVDVNRRACDSLGLDRGALVGRTAAAFDPDMTPQRGQEIAAALERLETVTFETRHRRADGTIFPVEVKVGPFAAGGRRMGLAVARDISERKRLDRERQELEEQVRAAQKMEAIGLLAGGIAHDFNNLLTVIGGHTELLLLQTPAQDPRYQELMTIRESTESAVRLTRQLLAFSRRAVVEPALLDLNAVVRSTTEMLDRVLGETIEVVLDTAEPLDPVVADAGQLEQVIANLAVNARDAMPGGGRLTIRTGALAVSDAPPPRLRGEPGRYVSLVVSDTGVGMSDETKARIFEPFFTTKPMGHGTGLGLATVFGIVTQAGGQITVDSAPGRGTTFTILLPAARGGRVAARPEAAATPLGGHETVLVAEDQVDVRWLTRRMLERLGYTVLEADSGPAAVELSNGYDGDVHLLITDVVMPGFGGRDLAERLRRARPALRVLYMSGYAHDPSHPPAGAPPAPAAGAAIEAFLNKPFAVSALGAKVRELLDAAIPGASSS